MIKDILVCFFLLSPLSAFAGNIRTIHMNADKMKTIHLRMGQSTILRFSDKPQKIVVGNLNYYSAEFIGNDVTIQPLGKFNTNLFVYTAHHVYGFLLRTTEFGRYDDLVNVRWKAVGMILEQKRRPLPIKEKPININIEMGDLLVHIHRQIINNDRGSHIFDFTVTNRGTKSVDTSKLDIVLTRSNKKLSSQEFAFEKDLLKADKVVRGRVLVRFKQKKGFTFNIHHGKKKKSKIISRWRL